VFVSLCESVCLCVHRVHELIQLASGTLTVARVETTGIQCENPDYCRHASTRDKDKLPLPAQSSMTEPTQLCTVAPCHSDAVISAVTNVQLSSVDDSVIPAESSATVQCTERETLQTCADARSPADEALYDKEAVIASCCVTLSHQPTALLTCLAVQTSDGLPMCVTKSVGSVSLIHTVSSVISASPQVSWVKPPTLLVPSVPRVSPVRQASSSVELQPVSAMDAGCGSDIVTRAEASISKTRHTTARSPMAGNLIVSQSSELPVESDQTQLPETRTSTGSHQLIGNTLNTSTTVDNSSKVPTSSTGTSKSLIPSTSVSPNCANKTVSPTLGYKDVDVANAVNVLASLRALSKLESKEPSVKLNGASPCRKRPRRVSTKTAAEVPSPAETEEKRTKSAKLDESVVASSATAQLTVENKDISSAVKVTGLTDTERVSCYKTIGAREERSRVIGLKEADRLRRRTAPAQKAAVVDDAGRQLAEPAAGKLVDESRSNESSKSSPRKPARRVPLLTVPANSPVTPTLFTLRSRARLAQLQLQEARSTSEESTTPADVHMTRSAEKEQAGTSSKRNLTDRNVSVTLCESSRTELVRPRGAEQMERSQLHSLPEHASSRQLRSSKKPDSNNTSPTATSQTTAVSLSTNMNNKSVVPGKLSTPVTDKSTSFSAKTRDITVSEPDSNISMAVTDRTAGDGARSSSRKCGRSDRSGIIGSGTVQDNPPSSHSHHEPNVGNDKKLDAKGIGEQMPSKNLSRNKSEPVKPRPVVTENFDHKKRTNLQKETLPSAVAVDSGSRVREDSGSGTRQNLKCQNNQAVMLQGVTVERGNDAAKLPDAAALQDFRSLSSSKPPDSSTSLVCRRSPAFNKDLSRAVGTSDNSQQVARRTSTGFDVSHLVIGSATSPVAGKQASTTTAKQEVNTSSVSDPVAHASSPLSMSRRASVDLFDVAIAGTPAHYANADDSSDNLLASPFSVDLANDAACEDMVSAVAAFAIPDNPAGEMVDASLFGKCILLPGTLHLWRCLIFLTQQSAAYFGFSVE